MLSEQHKAFDQWYVEHAFDYGANPLGSRDCGLMREGFAAGIAYAQTWRSMESAPIGPHVLLLLADGSQTIGRWSVADREIDLAAGWFDGMFRINPTGWLPLPPTQEAK